MSNAKRSAKGLRNIDEWRCIRHDAAVYRRSSLLSASAVLGTLVAAATPTVAAEPIGPN